MFERFDTVRKSRKAVNVIFSKNGELLEYDIRQVYQSIFPNKNIVYVTSNYNFVENESLCDPWQVKLRRVDGMVFNLFALIEALENDVDSVIILDITCCPDGYAKESFLLSIAGICKRIDSSNRLVLLLRDNDLDFLRNAGAFIKTIEITKPNESEIGEHIKAIMPGAFHAEKLKRLTRAMESHVGFYADIDELEDRLHKAAESNKYFDEFEAELCPEVVKDMTFKDIFGYETEKKKADDFIYRLEHASELATFEKQYKTGTAMGLFGPHGTGKTQFARALAGELNACFIEISPEEYLSEYQSLSSRNLANKFLEIKSLALSRRVVVFIDEADSLFGKRNDRENGDSIVTKNVLLRHISEISKLENIILIIASNRPESIDSAFLRSGRVANKLYISLPDDSAREGMLRYKIDGAGSEDIDYKSIVDKTHAYSGADIFRLVSEANLIRSKAGDVWKTKYLDEALQTVKSSVNKEDVGRLESWIYEHPDFCS